MSEEKFLVIDNADHTAWLKARGYGIGGSDASAILGMNPYKSNIELFEEKTGRRLPEDISDRSYVKYGTQAEPLIRSLFTLDYPEYQVIYHENRILRNETFPFMQASLDGELIDSEGRKGILEIKTTNILQSMQREKWKDRIPDNYYIQLLHYLMVTEFEFADLKAQLKYDFGGEVFLQTRHYHIERNEVEEDIKYLEAAERKFWQQVQRKEQPALILPEI